MIPISDANRTTTFPFVNVTIIVLNILMYLYEVSLSNINLSSQSLALTNFFFDWAVVPVEYTEGVDCDVVVGAAAVACRENPGLPPLMTLFSAMFMHGSLLHIGSNMLFLWVFGDNIENNMGHVKYLIFYLVCGVLASAAHILFNLDSTVPSLGASGAISGVLAAYLILFPRAQIRTLVFIFIFVTVTVVPAILLIGLWFALQFFQGIRDLGAEGQTSGVAVWAHIGGFIAGLLLVFVFRGRKQRYTERDYLYRPPPWTRS